MKQKRIIFGTDGWRGILGSEININTIRLVAKAFSKYISHNYEAKPVAIGYDGRKHSELFAREFAYTLSTHGLAVFLSDQVIPTPVLSFYTKYKACAGGVMITASHNPSEYNGIKFKTASGGPLKTEETKKVEDLIDALPEHIHDKHVSVVNFLEPYIDQMEHLIDFSLIKRSGISVAIDSMAGAGKDILENLFRKHGIMSRTIFSEPKEDFAGRNAEPIEQNLSPFSEFLKNQNFSLGVATDGDADRLGVMDDRGDCLNIQYVILTLAQYYRDIRKNQGSLVKTLSVTDKIYHLVEDISDIKEVQVGFKYVAEAMQEWNASFGAEESGGFGFKGHLPERDGLFSALIFTEMLARSGCTKLSEFMEKKHTELGPVFYSRSDMEFNIPGKEAILQKLEQEKIRTIAGFQVNKMQVHKSSRGIINSLKFRLEGKTRWLLIRVSETEPVARIYAEGDADNEVKILLQEGQNLLKMKIL